jgi:hypothetical protein
MSKNLEQILKQLADHEARIAALEGTDSTIIEKKKIESSDDSKNQNLAIANKANDCDETDAIAKILISRDMQAKLLVCFYVSHKYFGNKWLTTGDLEKITSELGAKIDIRNISNKIKDTRQFLESGATRRKGQPTPYRLNRKGVVKFTEIIHAQEN